MLTGPGFLITFLYYFSCTSLIVILVTWQALGWSLQTSLPYQLGTLVGLVTGLLGAYYNRSVSTSIPFTNKQAFLKTLNQSLSEMGYQQQEQLEDCIVYQKSKSRFSGKILVKIEGKSATLVGRSGILSIFGNKYKI